LFFGGWHFPGLTEVYDTTWGGYALRWCILLGKVAVVIGLIIQLRWTLPRFRFDQLMGVAWKGLIPLGIFNLLGLVVVLTLDLSKWWLAAHSLVIVFLLGLANVAASRRINTSIGRSQVLSEARPTPFEGA